MGNIKPHYENFLKVQKLQFHSTSSISMAHMTHTQLCIIQKNLLWVSLEKTPTFISMGSTSSRLGGNRG